jgi:uncharacterized membrane protein
VPGEVDSYAIGINDKGIAVGYTYDDKAYRAVRWNATGTPTVLKGLPGAGNSTANAINADGTIVGSSGGSPVRWAPDGTITELGKLSDDATHNAHAINADGVIAGQSHEVNDAWHPMRWAKDGTPTHLSAIPQPAKR